MNKRALNSLFDEKIKFDCNYAEGVFSMKLKLKTLFADSSSSDESKHETWI